ncbi:MAG: hypothetical protein AAGA96_11170 [Verrucomicrobiota bacterium]
MRSFLIRLSILIGLTSPLFGANPLDVPDLDDLIQPWLFVRASEASTLFIDEAFEGSEPYGLLMKKEDGGHVWLEFDGENSAMWTVESFEKGEKQLTLQLSQGASTSKLVVYPYWDIDHCLIMIRFVQDAEENPVRFATPYQFKDSLPYLEPEG